MQINDNPLILMITLIGLIIGQFKIRYMAGMQEVRILKTATVQQAGQVKMLFTRTQKFAVMIHSWMKNHLVLEEEKRTRDLQQKMD